MTSLFLYALFIGNLRITDIGFAMSYERCTVAAQITRDQTNRPVYCLPVKLR